jgi:hypothetical protein
MSSEVAVANPLLAPSAPAPAPAPAPAYRLYSPGQIAVATFLGSALSGAVLYALNLGRLRERRNALLVLAAGVAITALILAISFAVDLPHAAGYALNAGLWAAVRTRMTASFEAHVAAGGKRSSNWAVFGIMAGTLFLILVACTIVLLAQRGPAVHFGESSVHYKAPATEAQARAVGERLEQLGLIGGDADINLQLRREGEGYRLVMESEEKNPSPQLRLVIGHVAVATADVLAPAPLRFSLAEDFTDKPNVTFVAGGHVDAGEVRVDYLDGATRAQAQALVDAVSASAKNLVVSGNVSGSGSALMVSLVIADDGLDDAPSNATFGKLVHELPAPLFPAVRKAQLCGHTYKRCKPLP